MGRKLKKPGLSPVPPAETEIRRGALLLRPRRQAAQGNCAGQITAWPSRSGPELERGDDPDRCEVDVPAGAERHRIEVIPTRPRARKANLRELDTLLKFFDDPPGPLDAIRPTHVFNYLQWRRDAPVSANREKSLLSHLWNWCRKKATPTCRTHAQA